MTKIDMGPGIGHPTDALRPSPKPHETLQEAAQLLEDRAVTYDTGGAYESGERSMAATVHAFGDITGVELTEEQGWLFMVLLKAVRSQKGGYKHDNYADGAAYFALMDEAAAKERR